MRRAREAVSCSDGDIAGRVAIGLPSTVAIVLGLPLLRAAFAALPRVTIHLVESHTGFLREWLDTGRLDLAVLVNVTEAEGLELTPLLVRPTRPARHFWAARYPLEISAHGGAAAP